MVKAVFFDVGSTLLYPSPSVAEAFWRVAVSRGHDVGLAAVEALVPAMDAFYEEEYRKDGDFWASSEGCRRIWLDQYRFLAFSLGLQDDAGEIARIVHDSYHCSDAWAVYPDVAECLKVLKHAGLPLGIISNWDADLEDLVRGLGLLPYFDDVVASAAVGCRKPDPAIFSLALERMGIDARDAVLVGDHLEADGQGAAGVGMGAFIIDRYGKLGVSCPFPYARSLADIARCIVASALG